MSTDVLDQLHRFAPTAEDLESRWPADQRADLAARIVADEIGTGARLRHRAPRTWRARVGVGALVAAAAVAALAVPSLLPQGTPGAPAPAVAAELHRLADVAASVPADSLAPGQFVHTVTTSRQVGVPENPELGAVVHVRRVESWTAYDGAAWTRYSSPGSAPTVLRAPAYPETGAAYLASLPTESNALLRHLREHVHGSSSLDEAVFLALGDLMSDPTAPAALRSAAATSLADSGHVRLGPRTTDPRGREVVELDFADDSIRPGVVQAFLVDRETAQVVGRRTTQPGSSYTDTLVASSVVDAVPDVVVRTACAVNGPVC